MCLGHEEGNVLGGWGVNWEILPVVPRGTLQKASA